MLLYHLFALSVEYHFSVSGELMYSHFAYFAEYHVFLCSGNRVGPLLTGKIHDGLGLVYFRPRLFC